MGYQPVPRGKQQVGGAVIAVLGGFGAGWTWYTALQEGYYYENAAALSPAFLVLGVGLVLFPGYKEERLARGEDIRGLEGWQLLTPRWRVILVLSLLAGGANWGILAQL